MQPSASHRRVGSEGEPQFARSSHGQLDAYMETWEALLVAADQYGPLREAGEAITQVFCNDSERWYGEVLRFCKIVVSAMQANECKGIPEMFNPALCSCAGLDDVVTETLERADRYLAETGAAHPIHRRLAEEAEDLERRADKVAEKKLDTAGSISAVLKKMPRNNSLSSLGSVFGTETGSSLSGNSCQAFSMQSLRNSVKRMRPGLICKRALHEQRQKYIKDNRTSPVCTIRGMPASVAGDGGRTDSLIQELGSGMGSSPNSMSSEDHKFDENVATHRTRLNEWGRDNSEARQSDEVHAPTLTKVAENEILDWLSQSATSRSTRGSRFETTDLFDVESARPQEAPGVDIGRHLQKCAPVIGCAVFLVVIATVLAVVFGLKLGQKDSGTQEALASPIPVPSVGVDNVSTTSSALPCKACSRDSSEEGCFFNVSGGSCTQCAPCSAGMQRLDCQTTNAGTCTPCQAGSAKATNDTKMCVSCGQESFQPEEGAIMCRSCFERLQKYPCFPGQTLRGCGGAEPGSCS